MAIIKQCIINGVATHAELEKLAGGLGCAKLLACPMFARYMTQPLYAALFPKYYNPALDSATIRALKWWRNVLSHSTSRKVDISKTKSTILAILMLLATHMVMVRIGGR